MAESTPLEDVDNGNKSNQVRYFKAKELNTHLADKISEIIQAEINNKTIVFSCQSTSCKYCRPYRITLY